MGAAAPGGRSGETIRRQMQTEAGGRDPNAMGGFRNAPLRQEERRPQAGVQDARDKIRDADERREKFERVSLKRENLGNMKAMQAMMRERAEGEMNKSRANRMPSPTASFEPDSAADLAVPGGEQYGDMRGNLNRMDREKKMARQKADARQAAFAQFQAVQAQAPTDDQFAGSDILRNFQPTQGFGAYMSQMQTPDARSQTDFRDRYLGMADMRNAMVGDEQQRRFRAQQLRPDIGQENMAGLNYLNMPRG